MPLYQSDLTAILKGMKADSTANSNAVPLTPTTQLQTQQNQKQANGSFFDKLGHAVTTGAKDVGQAVGAVATPVTDVLKTDIVDPIKSTAAQVTNNPVAANNAQTDEGNDISATQHDTAQLARDVSGGALNQFTKAAYYTPEMVAADVENGVPGIYDPNSSQQAAATAQQAAIQRKAFGTNNSGQILKKIVGSTVGTAALVAGGASAGGEAAAEAGGSAVADGLTGAQRVQQALIAAGKTGAAGSVQNAASTEVNNPNATAGQLGTSAAVGFGEGAGLSALGSTGGALISKIFNRGASGALDELKGTQEATPASTEPKQLPAGNIQNDSTTTTPAIPGTPSTPSTVPVEDAEYTARFNALSDSYDKQTAAAAKLPPLAQKIALDNVDDTHTQALNQLNDEYLHGKPNPNYQPAVSGTPASTSPSGFVIQTPADQARIQIQKGQSPQLYQRINQINSIIKDAQQNGTQRSAEELRALIQEKAQAQAVLDGKANFNDVYGDKSQPGKVNSGMPFDNKTAPKVTNQSTTTGSGNPILDAVQGKGSAFMANLPKVAEGDTTQSVLNRNFVVGKYQDLIKPVVDLVSGHGVGGKAMDAHDIALIDKIEGNQTDPAAAAAHLKAVTAQAHNPKQFAAVVNAMREGYNARLANDASMGREVGIRNNYLQHFFDNNDKDTAAKLTDLQQKTQIINKDKPGYAHARTIENYDIADKLGLKRANANSLEDYYQAMTQAGGEHGAVALKQGLEQAHPGQVATGKIGIGTDGQRYDQLKISGGTALSMPKDLAKQYNARAPYEYQDSVVGKGLNAYDKLNSGIKYAKLGGGLFHSFTTAGTTLGQQVASLNLLKHPVENLKAIGGTLSKTVHESNFGQFEKEGSLDFARKTGVTLGAKQILADADVNKLDTPVAKATNIAGAIKNVALKPIVALHDMVFQRQIPEAKMLIMRQAMKSKFGDIDFNNPTTEQINYGRNVAKSVNNMGGINRAMNGLNYNTFKHVSRVVLATDFTEGKFTTLFNAFAKGGAEGKIARQMVIGKSLVFALPGMVAGVANGTINPKDPRSIESALMKQFITPSVPTGTMSAPSKSNPGGTPQVAELPKTFISELAGIIAPALDSTSTNKLSGVESYASARLAALPSTVEQFSTNKDFYGNPLYGTDQNGNPISPGKAAMNIGSEIAPIPAVQASKTATGGQNVKTAVMNTAGFRVVNDANSPQGQHSKAVSDFYNTTKMLGTKQAIAKKQIQALVVAGKVNQAQRMAQQWNDSIDSLVKPFREKYASHYNPAWDDNKDGFASYGISASGTAMKTRQTNAAEEAKILSSKY